MDYIETNGAWVHESAELASGVRLGPGAVVGPGVRIGPDCELGAHAVLVRDVELGAKNRVYPHAVLGGDPQDTAYAGAETKLVIGDENVFREGVTVHRGSTKQDRITRIGNGNYLMAGSHLGHDVQMSDHCIIANSVMVAGHCVVNSAANLSGGAAIAQFCTVGRLAFVGGLGGCRTDLEPFLVHDRTERFPRVHPIAVNKVGLSRAGVADEVIRELQHVFRRLFGSQRSGDQIEAIEALEQRGVESSEVQELFAFVRRKHASNTGRQLRPRA